MAWRGSTAAEVWDLVDRDPRRAAELACELLEIDTRMGVQLGLLPLSEHDPLACTYSCCNTPLLVEVRP